MEIITFLISGLLEHKDSMGNGRVIRPGEVQYMSAGSGVRHSEFNPSKDTETHLLQIWITPDEAGVEPCYADRSLADAPAGELHLVASPTGREGSFKIHQDADLWLARLQPGDSPRHAFASGRSGWLHVATGEVVVNGVALRAGDAVAATDEAALELVAVKPSQVLLFDLK
jgi:redox-sensitive bicupin YhaK (pirin superfamily)